MVHRLSRMILIYLIFIACILNQSVAQDADNDWVVLFNGKDLTGWNLLNGQHEVDVVDGVIVGTSIHGLPNGFLATENEYRDFILELEVKADLLLHNSGIQFRSLSIDEYDNGRVHGYQAEVDITPQGWSGGIYDEARRGWLYILEDYDSPAKKAWINNQWNHYRIEAIGSTIRIWVNGIPTAHLEDNKTDQGFIALQLHANTRDADPPGRNRVFFKNIRIKTENINPSPFDETYVVNLIPNTISPQEKYQGFKLLFDGETLDGWRGIPEKKIPEKGWEIKDGALTIVSKGDDELALPFLEASPAASGQGVLMTIEEYNAFELKFDFKQHTEGAIIGIEYLTNQSQRRAFFGRLASNKTRFMGQWNQGGIFNNVGDWNHARIIVKKDGEVEYWLNQRMILRYQRDLDVPRKGHILLDDYGGTVSFRSIKIKEL